MILFSILALALQDDTTLQYAVDKCDRAAMVHHGSLAIKIRGTDSAVGFVRSMHEIFSLQNAEWKSTGVYFRPSSGRHRFEARIGSIEGSYDDEPFQHAFVAGAPPKKLAQDKLLQLLWYLCVGGRNYALKADGAYLSDDANQEAWGEALDLYLNGIARMPTRRVRVGETWQSRWTSTRKQRDNGGRFAFVQTSTLKRLSDGVATIESRLAGDLQIAPERRDKNAEEAWTKASGTVTLRLEVATGRVLSTVSTGKVVAYYKGTDPETGGKSEVTVTFAVTGRWTLSRDY